MGFPRPEYWGGLPFYPSSDLPNPGIEPRSPALQADSLPAEPPGKPKGESYWASQVALVVKNLPANAGNLSDSGSVPGSGRSPGEGNGNPLQYSGLGNPMDRGAWQATIHGIAKSQTRLSIWAYHWTVYGDYRLGLGRSRGGGFLLMFFHTFAVFCYQTDNTLLLKWFFLPIFKSSINLETWAVSWNCL